MLSKYIDRVLFVRSSSYALYLFMLSAEGANVLWTYICNSQISLLCERRGLVFGL